MKHTVVTGLLTLCCTVGSASPARAPQGERPCERSNRAFLLASERRAEADFWLRVSQLLEGPEGNLLEELRNAHRERRSAEALARQVFAARETACGYFGHATYAPQVEPEDFTAVVTHPYWPLVPGRVLVREKHTAEGLERIETSVDAETIEIGGIECRAYREYETLDGVLVEDTRNWAAQHVDGSVWYFGELALTYEDDLLASLEGSWRFGDGGAQPGVLMLGTPSVGALYRQEFLLGTAEDVAQVLRVDETVSVPAGVFEHCLVIAEWDPLEPFEYLLTFIAPNVGLVLEVDTRTGERSELVEIRN